MNAYILSIGAELLHGHITDTNATFLSQELDARGIELLHVIQVGDDRNRIRESIERALSEAEIVICTGGIGPTEDDLTREGIADALGETPEVDVALRAEVEAFFTARGLTMPGRNAKKPGSSLRPGASEPGWHRPGWYVETRGKVIVSMPGVPREMKRMWAEQAAPRLGRLLSGRSYSSVTLKTIGIGESALEEMISDLVAQTNPIVATYAKDDGVHVRVVGIGSDEAEAREIRDQTAAEVTDRLSQWLYGQDDVSLAGSLARQLNDRGLRLRIIDQGGGGQFAALMLGDSDGAAVTIDSIARPAGGWPSTTLATEAQGGDPSVLGIGIAVDVSPAGTVHDGLIGVSVAGAVSGSQDFPMKSTIPELQRRSMLFTADVLHRLLDGSF
ncbi:MAG: molybdopterin-binding protein [Thermomicrobiales bacterium]|nr:molybdopterin-binding protein [Thermomicrobiales bacterium]